MQSKILPQIAFFSRFESVDFMSVCHMLTVYHVSAVITQMFHSNFIPVKFEQTLNVIFFFVRTKKTDLRLSVIIF